MVREHPVKETHYSLEPENLSPFIQSVLYYKSRFSYPRKSANSSDFLCSFLKVLRKLKLSPENSKLITCMSTSLLERSFGII